MSCWWEIKQKHESNIAWACKIYLSILMLLERDEKLPKPDCLRRCDRFSKTAFHWKFPSFIQSEKLTLLQRTRNQQLFLGFNWIQEMIVNQRQILFIDVIYCLNFTWAYGHAKPTLVCVNRSPYGREIAPDQRLYSALKYAGAIAST